MFEILVHPAKILRTTANQVSVFDAELDKLATEMAETMFAAEGVGLAAVQVNQNKNLFVMREAEKKFRVFVNPKITYYSVDKEMSEEGCLSVPDVYGVLSRSKKIHIKYQDLKGKTHKETIKGFDAIVCQHEVDHLNGILFIDDAQIIKGQDILKKMSSQSRSVSGGKTKIQ